MATDAALVVGLCRREVTAGGRWMRFRETSSRGRSRDRGHGIPIWDRDGPKYLAICSLKTCRSVEIGL